MIIDMTHDQVNVRKTKLTPKKLKYYIINDIIYTRMGMAGRPVTSFRQILKFLTENRKYL